MQDPASGSVARNSGDASSNATSCRLAPSPVSAFQVLKNQSSFSANCRCTRPIVCRNATASWMDSFVRASPPGPSIIAAVMSLETMIG